MESPPSDVLDAGSPRRAPHWLRPVSVTAAVALVAAAGIAALQAWQSRPPVSTQMGVTSLEIVGSQSVTIAAEPPIGALATPAGAALPGVVVRATVGGDPERAIEVTSAATDSLAYIQESEVVTIAPGSFGTIDVTMAPVDCGSTRGNDDLDEAGYRWRRPFGLDLLRTSDGEPVPLDESARDVFRTALETACRGSGSPPTIEVTEARRGGDNPLETIGLVVDVATDADRLVLTPLDGPGLRGLGSADRTDGKDIPLLWLVSVFTEETDPGMTAYVQAFAVRGGTAYPWIIAIPIPDDLPETGTALRR